MPYWRLLYHLVWATDKREPVLVDEASNLVERSIRANCLELETPLHGLEVMPDHVHIALSIPPKHSVSSVIHRLKGSSSHLLNHADERANEPRFRWQAEYGALSFGSKALPDVLAYIENQERRHAATRLWPDLERVDDG